MESSNQFTAERPKLYRPFKLLQHYIDRVDAMINEDIDAGKILVSLDYENGIPAIDVTHLDEDLSA
jgi:hypothetical protein